MLNVAAKQIKDIHREVKIVIIIAIREAEMISLFEIDVEWAYPNQIIEKSLGRLENKASFAAHQFEILIEWCRLLIHKLINIQFLKLIGLTSYMVHMYQSKNWMWFKDDKSSCSYFKKNLNKLFN